MNKIRRGLTHCDSRPIHECMTAKGFINGKNTTVTPGAAYEALTGGERSDAAAARERMLARRGINKETCSSEAARENMIRRKGGKDNGKAR